MSSKKNHAARSRKTHRWNLVAARGAMRGSMPWALRQRFRRILAGESPDEPVEEEKKE